jgi:hypothetical protein
MYANVIECMWMYVIYVNVCEYMWMYVLYVNVCECLWMYVMYVNLSGNLPVAVATKVQNFSFKFRYDTPIPWIE